jgi:hypothetical protein
VDFPAITDLDDRDEGLGVVNQIQDSIAASPNSMLLCAGELLTTSRMRVLREGTQAKSNWLMVFLGTDRLEFPRRRDRDQQPVACHVFSDP